MSLAVPPDLLEQAQRGEVDDAAFLDCVRTSLPYAWDLVPAWSPTWRPAAVSSPTTRSRRPTRRPAASCCG